jgi:hypothetical protein
LGRQQLLLSLDYPHHHRAVLLLRRLGWLGLRQSIGSLLRGYDCTIADNGKGRSNSSAPIAALQAKKPVKGCRHCAGEQKLRPVKG